MLPPTQARTSRTYQPPETLIEPRYEPPEGALSIAVQSVFVPWPGARAVTRASTRVTLVEQDPRTGTGAQFELLR